MRRSVRGRLLLLVGVAAVAIAWSAFGLAADITVKAAFFDSLGMGRVYELRWRWGLLLGAVGVLVSVLLAVPAVRVGRRLGAAPARAPRLRRPTGPLTEEEIERLTRRLDEADLAELSAADQPIADRDPDPTLTRLARAVGRGGGVVTLLLCMAVLVPGLVAARDRLLAAWHAPPFGVRDPVFGRDVAFFVFREPAIRDLVRLLASGLFIGLAGVLAVGLVLWNLHRQRGGMLQSRALLHRTLRYAFPVGGAFLLCMAVLLWLSRYGMTVGRGEVIAGAGAASRAIDIPTRAVGAVLVGVLAIGLVLLGSSRLRDRLHIAGLGTVAIIGAGLWTLTAVALVVLVSPWWLVLALPVTAVLLSLVRTRDQAWARTDVPVWMIPAFCAASAVVATAIGPVGALLNDAIVLRGNLLQVERGNLQATLDATRAASGLDAATVTRAEYRQNGVTRAAVEAAPASVSSLRFLDAGPAQQACQRLQAASRFYTCDDVDLDREVTADGVRRTVFVMGREIEYANVTDFQRRHFVYTHGYGLVTAPVNKIAANGRPEWIAGGFPQTGITPPLSQPGLYFGAKTGMPWAVVNTRQPVYDANQNRTDLRWCTGDTADRCEGEGGTGLRIGHGWRRLAITKVLGGLPYIGGGRRFWNATSGGERASAGPDSRLLLYRDIGARVHLLAPFLYQDVDPWFVAARGRVWVVQNLYVGTGRYPYAARFNGLNYVRQPVVAVMDAYSGRTYLFVTDPGEPMLRAWRAVYPDLFTDADRMDELAPGVREHLRYGEDLFDFQSQAAQRFHVTDVDTYFSGAEAWAPTNERAGKGLEGVEIPSQARYTYAVLPGETQERFILMRSYKPQAVNRSIGFSGWMAVSNEPDDFGRLTIINFTRTDAPLESLDTFSANVGRDPELTSEIGQRQNAVQRGNTIVVPIGKGLLYVQPLYLESAGADQLPSLFRVVVGFGDGRVFSGATFEEALNDALGTEDLPAGDDRRLTLAQAVAIADREYRAYRTAFGEGRDAEAARHLAAFQRAFARAAALAGRTEGSTP